MSLDLVMIKVNEHEVVHLILMMHDDELIDETELIEPTLLLLDELDMVLFQNLMSFEVEVVDLFDEIEVDLSSLLFHEILLLIELLKQIEIIILVIIDEVVLEVLFGLILVLLLEFELFLQTEVTDITGLIGIVEVEDEVG